MEVSHSKERNAALAREIAEGGCILRSVVVAGSTRVVRFPAYAARLRATTSRYS